MLNADFLAILACPACKKPLSQQNESLICQNPSCCLEYPIRNGIPVLLTSEAKKHHENKN